MSSDAERLEKLQKLLDFKRKVHTNPVEVGIDDLAWLIEKAAKQVYQQAGMI